MSKRIPFILILFVLYLISEPTPVYQGCEILHRFIFHFYHSNIWHLMANASCIYVMRRIRWFESYVIAFLCSWVIVSPTVGLSGIIFAAIGCNLGERGMWRGFWKCGLSAVVFGIMPGVSMVFHLACLNVGYLLMFMWRNLNVRS